MQPQELVSQGLLGADDHMVDRVSYGAVKETFAVTGPEDHIVQVGASGSEERIRLTAATYEMVGTATAVPTPAVTDRGWEHDTVPYLALERMPGENPQHDFVEYDSDRLDALVEEAGRLLGQVHAGTDLDGAGGLELRDDGPAGAEDDWAGFLLDRMEYQAEGLSGSALDREGIVDTAVAELRDRMDGLPADPDSSLLHNDYGPSNILVDGDGITAVLDWDNGLAGDPAYDQVRSEEAFTRRWDPETDQHRRELFREGYAEAAALPDADTRDTYRLAARIDQAHAMLWYSRNTDYELSDGDREYHAGGIEEALGSLQ